MPIRGVWCMVDALQVKSQSFEPERVPVYCLCELPDNPDKPMVMCEQCEEW